MSNTQKILNLLLQKPGLDDDEISRQADITPRQQVNQICRRLEGKGVIVRKIGVTGKIINFLAKDHSSVPTLEINKKSIAVKHAIKSIPERAHLSAPNGQSISPEKPEETLFVIPCSGKKTYSSAHYDNKTSIANNLPADLQDQFLKARRTLREQIAFDEEHLIPAWLRYDGYFYQGAREALETAISKNLNVIILSGGYGVLLATERIGTYKQRLNLSMWPKGLLQSVLQSYARTKGLRSMRALVSSSTDYCKLIKSTDWRASGIHDALLITPKVEGGGAMRKGPQAQGEAFAALLNGDLQTGWISTDNTGIEVQRL